MRMLDPPSPCLPCQRAPWSTLNVTLSSFSMNDTMCVEAMSMYLRFAHAVSLPMTLTGCGELNLMRVPGDRERSTAVGKKEQAVPRYHANYILLCG